MSGDLGSLPLPVPRTFVPTEPSELQIENEDIPDAIAPVDESGKSTLEQSKTGIDQGEEIGEVESPNLNTPSDFILEGTGIGVAGSYMQFIEPLTEGIAQTARMFIENFIENLPEGVRENLIAASLLAEGQDPVELASGLSMDPTTAQQQGEIEDALDNFQTLSADLQAEYRFVGSFMAIIANIHAVLTEVQGKIQEADQVSAEVKELRESEDLKEGLEKAMNTDEREIFEKLQSMVENNPNLTFFSLNQTQMAMAVFSSAAAGILAMDTITAFSFFALPLFAQAFNSAPEVTKPAFSKGFNSAATIAVAVSWVQSLVAGKGGTVSKPEQFAAFAIILALLDKGDRAENRETIKSSLATTLAQTSEQQGISESAATTKAMKAMLMQLLQQLIAGSGAQNSQSPGLGAFSGPAVAQTMTLYNSSLEATNDLQTSLYELQQAMSEFQGKPEEAFSDSPKALDAFIKFAQNMQNALTLANAMQYQNPELNAVIEETVFAALAELDPDFAGEEKQAETTEDLQTQMDEVYNQWGTLFYTLESFGNQIPSAFNGMTLHI